MKNCHGLDRQRKGARGGGDIAVQIGKQNQGEFSLQGTCLEQSVLVD
jgi:hypothetical protein